MWQDMRLDSNRRAFLKSASLLSAAAMGAPVRAAQPSNRLKVAAVVTEFYYRSHAHVILENFLEPYYFNGLKTDSGCEVVSLYVDKFTSKDMAREVAKEYGIPIFPTIAEALTLGGKSLAVDAVLSIGEHGDYPTSAKGQVEYPRKRFFDEIVAVFEKSGRVAPIFNDKHLSYRWDWAKEMFDTSIKLGIPLMAGSSVPLAERRPALEIAKGAKIVSAISIHAGPIESYDFHGLEVLQSMVEGRSGGETGVASVQFLQGDSLWKAAEDGLWSMNLANAAMAAEIGPGGATISEIAAQGKLGGGSPHGILVNYKDGLKGLVLKVGNKGTRWNFACEVAGESGSHATSFYTGPWDNRNLFRALSHAIQLHFQAKRAPYPVERTLLTSGMLDAAMSSRANAGTLQTTPELVFDYEPRDFAKCREMGATWKILTETTPQPKGIDTSTRGK